MKEVKRKTIQIAATWAILLMATITLSFAARRPDKVADRKALYSHQLKIGQIDSAEYNFLMAGEKELAKLASMYPADTVTWPNPNPWQNGGDAYIGNILYATYHAYYGGGSSYPDTVIWPSPNYGSFSPDQQYLALIAYNIYLKTWKAAMQPAMDTGAIHGYLGSEFVPVAESHHYVANSEISDNGSEVIVGTQTAISGGQFQVQSANSILQNWDNPNGNGIMEISQDVTGTYGTLQLGTGISLVDNGVSHFNQTGNTAEFAGEISVGGSFQSSVSLDVLPNSGGRMIYCENLTTHQNSMAMDNSGNGMIATFYNNVTPAVTLRSDGSDSPINANLQIFASNSAALSGGLSAGAFYLNILATSDTVVKIVHN